MAMDPELFSGDEEPPPNSTNGNDELVKALLQDEQNLVNELTARLENLRAERVLLENTVEQESENLVARLQAQLSALLSGLPSSVPSSPPVTSPPYYQTPFFETYDLPPASASASSGNPSAKSSRRQTPYHSQSRSRSSSSSNSSVFPMSSDLLENLQIENRALRSRVDEGEEELGKLSEVSEKWRRELVELRERCGLSTEDLNRQVGIGGRKRGHSFAQTNGSSSSSHSNGIANTTLGLDLGSFTASSTAHPIAFSQPHPRGRLGSNPSMPNGVLSKRNSISRQMPLLPLNGSTATSHFAISSKYRTPNIPMANGSTSTSSNPNSSNTSRKRSTSPSSPSFRLPSSPPVSTGTSSSPLIPSPYSSISPYSPSSTHPPSASLTTLTTPSTSYVPTAVPPTTPLTRSPTNGILPLLPLTSALGGSTPTARKAGFGVNKVRRPSGFEGTGGSGVTVGVRNGLGIANGVNSNTSAWVNGTSSWVNSVGTGSVFTNGFSSGGGGGGLDRSASSTTISSISQIKSFDSSSFAPSGIGSSRTIINGFHQPHHRSSTFRGQAVPLSDLEDLDLPAPSPASSFSSAFSMAPSHHHTNSLSPPFPPEGETEEELELEMDGIGIGNETPLSVSPEYLQDGEADGRSRRASALDGGNSFSGLGIGGNSNGIGGKGKGKMRE